MLIGEVGTVQVRAVSSRPLPVDMKLAVIGPVDVTPNWLTSPATIAAYNINKELTPAGGSKHAVPFITIRLVNGRLMANRSFLQI